MEAPNRVVYLANEPCNFDGVTICPAAITKRAKQRVVTLDEQEDAMSVKQG